jgi:uncharacterized phage protein gp47/JayE
LGNSQPEILNRCLDRVSSDFDKREGAIIYDSLSPVSFELAQANTDIDVYTDETFGDTASYPFLERRASERGLTPYAASKAIVRIVITPADLTGVIGARFNAVNTDLAYTVISVSDAEGTYQAQCETAGSIGNTYTGTVLPAAGTVLNGLVSAVIAGTTEYPTPLIPGEDKEKLEDFRTRYKTSFAVKTFGGNVADYKNYIGSIAGVGKVGVIRAYNGPGTVGIVITDSSYNSATQTLVDTVQEDIDPADGDGTGYAPIDHQVTVMSAVSETVNISGDFTIKEGYTFEGILNNIKSAVDSYLLTIRQQFGDSYPLTKAPLTVYAGQILYYIMNMTIGTDKPVVNLTNVTVNGNADYYTVGTNGIPVLGSVTNGSS